MHVEVIPKFTCRFLGKLSHRKIGSIANFGLMANLLGIDIGARYTKVVDIEFKPALTAAAAIIFKTPFLSPAIPGTNQLDIKNFWQEITNHIPLEKVRLSRIGVNLASSSITALTLLLPRVAKNELATIARTEAKRKMIPASGPNHIFESALIGTRIVAKIPRYEVLIARSDITYVTHILELFKHLHLHPELITFSSSALFTMLPAQTLQNKEVDAAFVDIGIASITTSFLREGRLVFFRNTAFGLNDIIKDIAKNLSLSDDETEKVIFENGVPEGGFDLKNKVELAEEIMRQKYEASLNTAETRQKETINLLELRMLWQAHLDRILHELRRSLTFYKEQSEGRRVEYIYFLGGGAQIKNLVSILIKQIGGECQIVSPFKNMHAPNLGAENNAADSIFTNAASIALSIAQKEKGIAVVNFLPQELKTTETRAKKRLVLSLTAIICACIFAFSSFAAFINNQALSAALRKAQASLNMAKDTAETLRGFGSREKKVAQDTAEIETITKNRINFALPLASLAKSIPKDILLTQLTLQKGQVALSLGEEVPAEAMPQDTENPSSAAQGTSAETYYIGITAMLSSDFENALSLIERFRQALTQTSYFNHIIISPLQLEEISPQRNIHTGRVEGLTRSLARTFSVSAEIAIPTQ